MILSGVNKVLIKPLKENDFIVKDGVVFYVNTSYQKEKHAISCGTIISNPLNKGSEIETREGDIVFFHYLSTLNAIKDKKFIQTDDGILYSVNYESLYCAKRGEEVICLNGFTLVKPLMVHKEDKIGDVYLPESMMQKEITGRGVVAHTGSRLVSKGDEILYRKTSNVPIEYPLHQQMDRYFRMKDSSILAIAQSETS